MQQNLAIPSTVKPATPKAKEEPPPPSRDPTSIDIRKKHLLSSKAIKAIKAIKPLRTLKAIKPLRTLPLATIRRTNRSKG